MGRYYSDYRAGKFPNQRLLNEAISTNNQTCLLQTDEANALTVRLLVAAESVDQLEKTIRRESSKISDSISELQYIYGPGQQPTGLMWGTETMYFTSGSGIARPTPYLLDPSGRFQNSQLPQQFSYQGNRITYTDKENIAFPLVEAHIAIYNFFTNYGSALDRFAGEVNRLYDLQISPSVIDWGYLARNLQRLANKHQALSDAIDDYHQNRAARLLRYRNRLLHDGLIRVTAEVTRLNQWKVMISNDPDNVNSPIHTDALFLCRDTMQFLIQFLDRCYGHILAQLRGSGQPPW